MRIQEVSARHPLPHSLRSISDTLDELGVENAVYRLEFEQLFEIEGAFIVVAGKDEYPFHIVERLDRASETVTLHTTAGRRVTLSFEQFRAVWDGTVLMAEKGEWMQEDNPVVYWFKQGFAFFDRTALYWMVGLAVYFLIWATVQSPVLGDLRYLAKTAGVVVSLLVMITAGMKYDWKNVDEVIRNWYEKQVLPPYLDVYHYAKGDLEQQINYCRQIGIEGTPTVLVDNRRLPELYDIQDLKILL